MPARAIWKFTLPVRAEPTMLAMPIGAHVLSVQTQQDEVRLWALVDPNEDREDRRFIVVATGQSFDPSDKTYLGTVQTGGGVRVFHVWEVQ